MRLSRRVLATAVLLAAATIPFTPAAAQDVGPTAGPVAPAPSIPIGTRVRVRLERDPADPYANDQYTGMLGLLDADSVVLLSEGVRRGWARSRVRGIDVRSGGRTRGESAWRGAYIGGGVGFGVALLTGLAAPAEDDLFGPGFYVLVGALVFVPTGALIGAVAGASTANDSWRPVATDERPVRLHVGARSVGVAIPFGR